jgi:hypothetical protein
MRPRCVLVIPDSGPLNSLWTAGRLDLLTALDMPIVMIDKICAEATSDETYPKEREVKAFLDNLKGRGLTIEETFVGKAAKAPANRVRSRVARTSGMPPSPSSWRMGCGNTLPTTRPCYCYLRTQIFPDEALDDLRPGIGRNYISRQTQGGCNAALL